MVNNGEVTYVAKYGQGIVTFSQHSDNGDLFDAKLEGHEELPDYEQKSLKLIRTNNGQCLVFAGASWYLSKMTVKII